MKAIAGRPFVILCERKNIRIRENYFSFDKRGCHYNNNNNIIYQIKDDINWFTANYLYIF